LPEQRLMRRFDRDLSGSRRHVGRKQPLLDQKIDESAGLLRNLGEARHPPAGAARLGVDSGKPGNEPAPQQSDPGGTIIGDYWIGVGGSERALDSGFNRAFDAAKLLIFGEPEIAIAAILHIKPLQGEGEER
jgi:hypothetical protein